MSLKNKIKNLKCEIKNLEDEIEKLKNDNKIFGIVDGWSAEIWCDCQKWIEIVRKDISQKIFNYDVEIIEISNVWHHIFMMGVVKNYDILKEMITKHRIIVYQNEIARYF